jgi:hypothetical protein
MIMRFILVSGVMIVELCCSMICWRSAHTMSAITYEVYADIQMCVMAPKWPEQWQNAAHLHEDAEMCCVERHGAAFTGCCKQVIGAIL